MSPGWFRSFLCRSSHPVRKVRRLPRRQFRVETLEDRTVPTATIASIQVNDGSAQRSEVRSITVTFSGSVTFPFGGPTAAFELQNETDYQNVNLTAAVSADAQGRTVVTLTFSGAETDPISALNGGVPSLADSRYEFMVISNNVSTADGTPLDGDGDGVQGGNYVSPVDTNGGGPGQLQLFRMFGDVNGDGVVDALDLGQLRQSYNTGVGDPLYLSCLDADNSGFIDTRDLAQFRERYGDNVLANATGMDFYVNPATGNDANNGRTPGTAWATWARLIEAVNDREIWSGGWATNANAPAGMGTLPTTQATDAWYTAYLNHQRQVTGSTIFIDTSEEQLQVTGALNLPPGCEIRSATDSLTNLEVNLPIASTEAWASLDNIAYPDVWVTTSNTNYAWTGLYEQVNGQWAQLLPIAAGNLNDALPSLEADPGSFFVDPATNRLYTHTLGGGDPNTDGVSRQYVPAWAATLGGRVIDVTGGEAYLIGGDGGFGFDPTTSQAQGTAGVGSGEWDTISVIDSCAWSRAGKHTFSAVGNFSAGLTVFRDDTASEGPGGVFTGYWSHFVDYTSYSGTGSIVTIYDGCSTIDGVANVDAPGGSDGDGSYAALIEHTNLGNVAFAQRLLMNCVFNGGAVIGSNTALAEAINCTFNGSVGSNAATTIINGGIIANHMPSLGQGSPTNATLTGVTIEPGTVFTGSPYYNCGIAGTITLNDCNINLSGGNIYSTAWGADQGTVDLTLNDCKITLLENWAYGLVFLWQSADTLKVTGSAIYGFSDWPIFVQYNGTSTNQSWQWARDLGLVDGTNMLNGLPWTSG